LIHRSVPQEGIRMEARAQIYPRNGVAMQVVKGIYLDIAT
jgi:hypothetical protein